MKRFFFISLLLLLSALIAAMAIGCGGDDDDDDDDDDSGGTGVVEFYANGEDFIRNGFKDKTEWNISFDHFFVNLSGLTAYQVAEDSTSSECGVAKKEAAAGENTYEPFHAGHPHSDIPEGSAHVALAGSYFIDLTQGTEPILVDSVPDAPIGNYNYAAWNMIQSAEGEYAGYSIIMIGTAEKDSETIQFTIKLSEEMTFSSCHQEVDDEYAGVVEKGGVGTVETTYHSDHLFGDYESLGDPESVNPGALGFQAFADLATEGVLQIDQAQMEAQMNADDYATFLAALFTLGHSGEGHCNYSAYEAE